MTLKISDYEVENAKRIIDSHTVNPLTKEGALESLLFCIASQAWRWEKASSFIHSLRERGTTHQGYALWKNLMNKEYVNSVAKEKGYTFHHENRFDSSINFFGKSKDSLDEFVQANNLTRERYCNEIKFLGYKTFSFWHICLGGKNLIALDIHVMRKLSQLGISMDNYYFESKPRVKGDQKVRRTPDKIDYVRIEELARDLFSKDERFLDEQGKVDLSLVDGVLWWRGANRDGGQLSMFNGDFEDTYLPYSKSKGS